MMRVDFKSFLFASIFNNTCYLLGIPLPPPKGAQLECIIFHPFSVEIQTEEALVL
jgi:hypothetical protein